MVHYIYHKAYILKTRAEQISKTLEFPPKKFNMTKISSTDASIYAAQYLIHALNNSAPEIPLVTLGNLHKESLRSLSEIFVISTYPAVPMRVPVRGAYQGKI